MSTSPIQTARIIEVIAVSRFQVSWLAILLV